MLLLLLLKVSKLLVRLYAVHFQHTVRNAQLQRVLFLSLDTFETCSTEATYMTLYMRRIKRRCSDA